MLADMLMNNSGFNNASNISSGSKNIKPGPNNDEDDEELLQYAVAKSDETEVLLLYKCRLGFKIPKNV